MLACTNASVLACTNAVQLMEQLIEDTFDIAEAHVPTIDWRVRRQLFRRRRLPVDKPLVIYE